jgi:CSLREA domain-containing protein
MIGRHRIPIRLLLVTALVLAALLVATTPSRAGAQIFTVNSTADLGNGICNAAECTLREAIAAANANPGADTIEFGIPGAGVHTIQPTSELPAITEAVTIDGYSQPGASPNTKPQGTNAKLRIELSGAAAPVDAIGLVIEAGPTTVRGLVINRFRSGGLNGDAISMNGGVDNVVAGNFIGTDPSGRRGRGNGGRGIECYADCASARIGGPDPADRNLISGNGTTGLLLFAGDNLVQGNLIGTDKSGRKRLGNDDNGIFISNGSENLILGNVIAFNAGVGVVVNGNGSASNRVLGNAIFENAGLGIDLGSDGATANDGAPDIDAGPNGLQDFPVITAAKPNRIEGTIATTPSTGLRLEFFVNPKRDKQGRQFLGSIAGVSTNGDGNFGFVFFLNKPLKAGQRITAAATTSDDGTSEFSLPKKVA